MSLVVKNLLIRLSACNHAANSTVYDWHVLMLVIVMWEVLSEYVNDLI